MVFGIFIFMQFEKKKNFSEEVEGSLFIIIKIKIALKMSRRRKKFWIKKIKI